MSKITTLASRKSPKTPAAESATLTFNKTDLNEKLSEIIAMLDFARTEIEDGEVATAGSLFDLNEAISRLWTIGYVADLPSFGWCEDAGSSVNELFVGHDPALAEARHRATLSNLRACLRKLPSELASLFS